MIFVLDADGDTMLHRVCDVGHEQLAMLLIRHGANVNSLNNQGRPPAHIAAKAGHVSLFIVSIWLKTCVTKYIPE